MAFVNMNSLPPTGATRLDDCQRRFVSQVNAVYDIWQQGAPVDEVRKQVKAAEVALLTIFQCEESLSSSLTQTAWLLHAQEHQGFLDTFHEICQKLQAGQQDFHQSILDFFVLMEQLVYDHLMIDNQDYYQPSLELETGGEPQGFLHKMR